MSAARHLSDKEFEGHKPSFDQYNYATCEKCWAPLTQKDGKYVHEHTGSSKCPGSPE